MEITFLIGNGFDIGLGMRTQYSQFIPRYIKNGKNKSTVLKDFSEQLGKNIDKWSYFEKQIGEYTLEFSKDNKYDLIDQLEDFEKEFIAYLLEEESKLEFNDSDKIGQFFQETILKFYETLHPESITSIKEVFKTYRASGHNYNFISFNYTQALDKCLEKIPNKKINTRKVSNTIYTDTVGKVVHVHGLCNQFPLIGLNDVEQIKNSELANNPEFVKYLIKPSLNKLHRMGNASNASKMIDTSKIICIYGMSLGETDLLWWNKLVVWLNGGNDRHLIVFEHDDHFSRSSQFGWIRKMDSLIDKLQSYNKNPGIKLESLRDRIHLSLKDIFAYPLLEKESNNQIESFEHKIEKLQDKVDKTTQIYIGKEERSNAKEGDIWVQVVE